MEIKNCIECSRRFNPDCSKMKELCPDCAKEYYGYENCENVYEDGRCTLCFWESAKSK